MNVNEMLERLQNYIFGELMAGVGVDHDILTHNAAAVLGAAVVMGLLIGFLGWKIVRVWAALAGVALGSALGIVVAAMAGFGADATLITAIAAAVVCAVLGTWLYRCGIFLIVFLEVSSLLISLADPQNWIVLIVCLLASLVCAVLSIRYAAVLTIIVTGIYGAMMAGTAFCALFPAAGGLIRIILCIVLAAGGIAVQLLLESKKQKAASLRKADQIREEKSVENDVERARAVFDNSDSDNQ